MQNKNPGEWSSYSIHAQNTKHSEALRRKRKSCLGGNKLSFDRSNGYGLNSKSSYNRKFSTAETQKSRLRNLFLTKRKNLAENKIEDMSLSISENIFLHEKFNKSLKIALYHPVSAEVNTKYIFKRSVKEGKETFFPKVRGEELHFYRIKKLSELNPGFNGIPEPDVSGEMLDAKDLDLIIIPGLAFDCSGNRLGYGGGFFDRYLKEIPVSRTVALAYDFQVTDSLPVAEHDVKIGMIVTESRVIDCLYEKGGIKCKP